VLGYLDRFGQTQGRVGIEDERVVRLDPDVRRVRQTGLPRTSETEWVYERLASVIDRCNQEYFGFDLHGFDEDLAIVDYRSGDFYDWHLDLGRAAPSRKLSVSVLLSAPEEYDGGGLTFPGTVFDRVARGGAVLFPSFLLHGVQPVTRGRRCALLAWVGGPRFR
jgi:PKHD-type hydroxylase